MRDRVTEPDATTAHLRAAVRDDAPLADQDYEDDHAARWAYPPLPKKCDANSRPLCESSSRKP